MNATVKIIMMGTTEQSGTMPAHVSITYPNGPTKRIGLLLILCGGPQYDLEMKQRD